MIILTEKSLFQKTFLLLRAVLMIILYRRIETMHNRDLWKCDVRNKDQIFCVLSKLHNMWLRAIIEKELSESDVSYMLSLFLFSGT